MHRTRTEFEEIWDDLVADMDAQALTYRLTYLGYVK
jgi:hypothetical protein